MIDSLVFYTISLVFQPYNSGMEYDQLIFSLVFYVVLQYISHITAGAYLFVWLGFIVPLENFSLIRRRNHYRWRAANFDLCSALMAIEQWGFFSISYLLWYGASIKNGDFRGPMTLTPIGERLALELSLPVFKTYACRRWDSNTQPSACEANALTNCATAAFNVSYKMKDYVYLRKEVNIKKTYKTHHIDLFPYL